MSVTDDVKLLTARCGGCSRLPCATLMYRLTKCNYAGQTTKRARNNFPEPFSQPKSTKTLTKKQQQKNPPQNNQECKNIPMKIASVKPQVRDLFPQLVARATQLVIPT